MQKPRLSLKRERLTELTAADLTNVAGGAYAVTVQGLTCPLKYCVDPGFTDTSCNCCTASGSC